MPVFFILVILGAALLWLLLSFVFLPIGRFVCRLLKDAMDAMEEEEPATEEKEKEN